jgi:hypothetical protein
LLLNAIAKCRRWQFCSFQDGRHQIDHVTPECVAGCLRGHIL